MQASESALRCNNPIYSVLGAIDAKPRVDKKMIPLALGDPTLYGNLRAPAEAIAAVHKWTDVFTCHGYQPTVGPDTARAAVAKYMSTDAVTYAQEDIILSPGASGGIEASMAVLCDAHSNILIPSPGFASYVVSAGPKYIDCRFYKLLPEHDWEADLEHMESLIDGKTRAILVNNPSNPCGSNYSRQHLQAIIDLAQRYCIPIISDEIYAHMTWSGEFVPMADLASDVPILTVGGIGKRFICPGWRIGWIAIHDPIGAFTTVRQGLSKLTTINLHPCSVMNAALPDILANTPPSYFAGVLRQLEENASLTASSLSSAHGLTVTKAKAAMYTMCRIDFSAYKDIHSAIEFVQKLVHEQAVLALPRECFEIEDERTQTERDSEGFIRIVISHPKDVLMDAYARIHEFCTAHAV